MVWTIYIEECFVKKMVTITKKRRLRDAAWPTCAHPIRLNPLRSARPVHYLDLTLSVCSVLWYVTTDSTRESLEDQRFVNIAHQLVRILVPSILRFQYRLHDVLSRCRSSVSGSLLPPSNEKRWRDQTSRSKSEMTWRENLLDWEWGFEGRRFIERPSKWHLAAEAALCSAPYYWKLSTKRCPANPHSWRSDSDEAMWGRQLKMSE